MNCFNLFIGSNKSQDTHTIDELNGSVSGCAIDSKVCLGNLKKMATTKKMVGLSSIFFLPSEHLLIQTSNCFLPLLMIPVGGDETSS